MKRALLSTLVCLITFNTLQADDVTAHGHFASTIGEAHGIDAYRSQQAVQADLTVNFGGGVALQGVVTFDTPVGKSRIETADGTVMVLDGQDAYVSPSDAAIPASKARFHLLTWPYFIAAPFKLGDPGTKMGYTGNKPLDDQQTLSTAKLTFKPGTGDSPDDWYIVYQDTETNQLAAMAYIVTYGKDTAEAEKKPHVAIYESFTDVDGVLLPTRMSIYNWEAGVGKVGEELGSMEVSNYRFIEPGEDTFSKPEGARIDEPATTGE